ncbi:transcription initiation factor TFIID subunit 6 isoform X1 [Drosophila simulans]|nr:transcription initiation factor TFIID subunit 6 isoform X1 [Drosophila simulans]KMZ01642.1 uncharacterized protein Dsimw501_GD19609, isoform A [Drosophila simulans]
MWQFENKNATKMKTSDNEMPDKDESFRKHSLSPRSISAIFFHSTGQRLDDEVAQWLSFNVKEDIKNLLNEAGKYMRRIRDRRLQLSHIQHAVRMHDDLCHDIFFRLVHCDDCTMRPAKNVLKTVREAVTTAKGDEPLVFCPESVQESVQESVSEISLEPPPLHSGWMKVEQVLLKPCKRYPLSMEQQNFFELVTEACVGDLESRRVRALKALSTDPSLEDLLPRLTKFIADAVAINMAQQNLSLLLYLMRMVQALLKNQRFSLLQYLHLLLPAVLSCLLAKQVCASPDLEDHWALREYSGNIISQIVRQFDAAGNGILPRLIGVYKKALSKKSLTTVFGAVLGLGKMGSHVVRACILPQLKYLSEHIDSLLAASNDSPSSSVDRQAVKYIRHRLVKMCSPVLAGIHEPPDLPEEYMERYGSLGTLMCDGVIVTRTKKQAEAAAKAEAELKLKNMAAEHLNSKEEAQSVGSNDLVSGTQMPKNGVRSASQASQSVYSISVNGQTVTISTPNPCNTMLQHQAQDPVSKPSDSVVPQSVVNQFKNGLIPSTSLRSSSPAMNMTHLKPNNDHPSKMAIFLRQAMTAEYPIIT